MKGVKLTAGVLSANTPGEERVKGQSEALSGTAEELFYRKFGKKCSPIPNRSTSLLCGAGDDSWHLLPAKDSLSALLTLSYNIQKALAYRFHNYFLIFTGLKKRSKLGEIAQLTAADPELNLRLCVFTVHVPNLPARRGLGKCLLLRAQLEGRDPREKSRNRNSRTSGKPTKTKPLWDHLVMRTQERVSVNWRRQKLV